MTKYLKQRAPKKTSFKKKKINLSLPAKVNNNINLKKYRYFRNTYARPTEVKSFFKYTKKKVVLKKKIYSLTHRNILNFDNSKKNNLIKFYRFNYLKGNQKFYQFFLPLVKYKKKNLEFPKKINLLYFNTIKKLNSRYLSFSVRKQFILNSLQKWINLSKIQYYNLKNHLVRKTQINSAFPLFLHNFILKKKKRQWFNNWKINKIFFISKLIWSKIRAKWLKKKSGKRVLPFNELQKRRWISWKNFKTKYNRFVSMQLRATGKFFNLVKQKTYYKKTIFFAVYKFWQSIIFFNRHIENKLKYLYNNVTILLSKKYLEILYILLNNSNNSHYRHLNFSNIRLSQLLNTILNFQFKFFFIKKLNFFILQPTRYINFIVKNDNFFLNNFYFNSFKKIKFFKKTKAIIIQKNKFNKNSIGYLSKFQFQECLNFIFLVKIFKNINFFTDLNFKKKLKSKLVFNINSYIDTKNKRRSKSTLSTKFLVQYKTYVKYNYFLLNSDWKWLKFFELVQIKQKFILNIISISKNLKKIIFFKIWFNQLLNKIINLLFLRFSNFDLKLNKYKFYFLKSITKNWSVKWYYGFFYSYIISYHILLNNYKFKNNYFYSHYNYSLKNWIRNKKFYFWLESEIEKLVHFNVKLIPVNAVKTVAKSTRNKYSYLFNFLYIIKNNRKMGGWREQTIYADILWTILISVKYFSSSCFADMLSEQIIKRKKQWGFIKKIRACVCEMWPSSGLINPPYKVYGFKVNVNGKINGRDRSISHVIQKRQKDYQKIKFFWIRLRVDYSLRQAKSKYGSFGLRVWISRL